MLNLFFKVSWKPRKIQLLIKLAEKLDTHDFIISLYIFVNNISNFNPRIKILLFLDSAKSVMLKNVQNAELHFKMFWKLEN